MIDLTIPDHIISRRIWSPSYSVTNPLAPVALRAASPRPLPVFQAADVHSMPKILLATVNPRKVEGLRAVLAEVLLNITPDPFQSAKHLPQTLSERWQREKVARAWPAVLPISGVSATLRRPRNCFKGEVHG